MQVAQYWLERIQLPFQITGASAVAARLARS